MTLDVILAQRKMKARALAAQIGISETRLSQIKTGHIKGIRFSTLIALCDALDCQPGDILRYEDEADDAD